MSTNQAVGALPAPTCPCPHHLALREGAEVRCLWSGLLLPTRKSELKPVGQIVRPFAEALMSASEGDGQLAFQLEGAA